MCIRAVVRGGAAPGAGAAALGPAASCGARRPQPPHASAVSRSRRRARCRRPIRGRSSTRSSPASRPRATSRSSTSRPTCITSSSRPSRPSEGVWVPYDEAAEKTIRDDFKRLWATNFLDNLSIDADDYTFSNGVVGKLVIYNMEERQRVKIVDYAGSKKVETSKIDEKLKEDNAQIRLDTFIDPGAHPEGRGHRPRHDEGEGLSVRRGHARHHGGARRSQARAPHLQHGRGAEGQDSQDRVHRQPGGQRRRAASAR